MGKSIVNLFEHRPSYSRKRRVGSSYMITNLIFFPVSLYFRPVLLAHLPLLLHLNVDRLTYVDLVNAVLNLMELEVVNH